MSKIDQIFKVEPETIGERKVVYERWRAGLQWTAIGAVALGAGMGVDLGFGIEEGLDLGAAGFAVTLMGISRAAYNLGRLQA